MKTLSLRLLTPFVICLAVFNGCKDEDNALNIIDTDAPTVSSFTPQTAFVGDTITLEGTHLDDNVLALSIQFGKVHASLVEVSATRAKLVVPDDMDGATARIQFTTFKGAVVSVGDFKLKAPVIESFSPASGYAGQEVVIKGKGFRKINGSSQVRFGDKLVDAAAAGHTQLSFQVPTGTPVGDYPIAVTVAGLTATAAAPFHVIAPALTSFSPETAFIGEAITLTGKGFGTDPDRLTIYFGGVQATVVSAAETSATVVVPDDLEAMQTDIRFSLPGGTDLVAPNKFTVKAPVIESISPTSGLPGQQIRIKGKGFRNSYHFPQISFGGTPIAANVVNPIDNTELIMHVPDKATAGTYAIEVDVLGNVALASDQFEVIVPTVTGFTPESGDEFTTVTITGTNLVDPNGGNTFVGFFDTKTGLNYKAAYVLSHSATEIKVDVPRLTKGTWSIRILVLGASVTLPKPFDYTGENL